MQRNTSSTYICCYMCCYVHTNKLYIIAILSYISQYVAFDLTPKITIPLSPLPSNCDYARKTHSRSPPGAASGFPPPAS